VKGRARSEEGKRGRPNLNTDTRVGFGEEWLRLEY